MMACLVPTSTFRWFVRTTLIPTMHEGRVQNMPQEFGRTLQQAYQNIDTGEAVWQDIPMVRDCDEAAR